MMNISVIIVNYHTPLLIRSLVEDLNADSLVDQIIIIDNSRDFIDDLNSPWMADIDIVVNEKNHGFGFAVNQGVRLAGGEWILVVNPDVRIERGCLETLMNAARHYGSSLVGPRFFWDDEHLFRIPPATGACFWQDVASMSSQHYTLDADLFSFYWIMRHERFWDASEPFFEPFLSGACLLIEKKWVESIGGEIFDQDFFLYFEDTDLVVRAIRDGIRPIVVPGANAVHYYDQSPSPNQLKSNLMADSHLRFQKKYYTPNIPRLENRKRQNSEVSDLGEVAIPMSFQCPKMNCPDKYFLEIGVNSCFFPFTQAEFVQTDFQFPWKIWDRMAPGEYYGRIRGKISGVRKVIRWKKLP